MRNRRGAGGSLASRIQRSSWRHLPGKAHALAISKGPPCRAPIHAVPRQTVRVNPRPAGARSASRRDSAGTGRSVCERTSAGRCVARPVAFSALKSAPGLPLRLADDGAARVLPRLLWIGRGEIPRRRRRRHDRSAWPGNRGWHGAQTSNDMREESTVRTTEMATPVWSRRIDAVISAPAPAPQAAGDGDRSFAACADLPCLAEALP